MSTWLRQLAANATPGPWEWKKMVWPNERVTTLRSQSACYPEYRGVPRSVLKRIDHISEDDARLIALAPQLALLCADLIELVEPDADLHCDDDCCGSFSCRAYQLLARLDALQPKDAA